MSVLVARNLLLKRNSLRFAWSACNHQSAAYFMKCLFLISGREGRQLWKIPKLSAPFWTKMHHLCFYLWAAYSVSYLQKCVNFPSAQEVAETLEMKRVEFRSWVSQSRYIRNSSQKAGTLFVNQVTNTGRPMPRYSQRLPGTENDNYHLLSSSFINKYLYNSDSSVSKHS